MDGKLLLYLGVLIIGIIIGSKDLFGTKIYSKLDKGQTLSVLGLLFVMGLRIGLDKKIVASIGTIGIGAALVAIMTVGFSILFVWIGKKLFLEKSLKKVEVRDNEY